MGLTGLKSQPKADIPPYHCVAKERSLQTCSCQAQALAGRGWVTSEVSTMNVSVFIILSQQDGQLGCMSPCRGCFFQENGFTCIECVRNFQGTFHSAFIGHPLWWRGFQPMRNSSVPRRPSAEMVFPTNPSVDFGVSGLGGAPARSARVFGPLR